MCRRLESLSPEEYARLHNDTLTYNQLRAAATSVISLDNEWRTIRKLKTEIFAALNEYPTKIEEDEKLLEDKTLPADVRMAISLRRAEKYVWIANLKKLDRMWGRLVR